MKGNVVKLMDKVRFKWERYFTLMHVCHLTLQLQVYIGTQCDEQVVFEKLEAMACVFDIAKLRRIIGLNVGVATRDRFGCNDTDRRLLAASDTRSAPCSFPTNRVPELGDLLRAGS